MSNNKKIHIENDKYILCTNEKQEKYLYKYDSEYQIGIKLTFSDEDTENTKDRMIQMLSNQYIQKILVSKEI